MRPSHRTVRVLGALGLAVLVVSTAGAIFALNPNGVKGQRPGVAVDSAGRGVAPLVCYGTLDLEHGVLPLCPVQAGRVVELPVHENQSVKKGDVLMRFDDRLAKARVEEAKGAYDAAVADLELAQKLPDQYKAKAEQQQQAIAAATHEFNAGQRALDRKRQLEKDKLLNPLEVAAAEELAKKAEAGVKAEEAKMRELKLFDPKLQLDRATAQVAAKKAQLQQAELGLDELRIVAPGDGQVLQILAAPGTLLPADPRMPAIFFAPAGPRIVRAEIEQEFANRLSQGQTVKVQDEYGSGNERSGKVSRIADWFTRSRQGGQDPMRGVLSSEVRTLECIITLDPGQPVFRLGQRVRVTAGKGD